LEIVKVRTRAQRRIRRAGMLLAVVALVVGVSSALAHRTISRHQAPGVVATVELRHSDLPSLRQQRNPITATEKRLSAQVSACTGGVPDSQDYAQAQSPSFASGGSASSLTIDSTSSVLPSSALVAKDLAAATGAKAQPCLERPLRAQLQGSMPKGASSSVQGRRMPAVVDGSDGTFRWRFTVVVTVHENGATAHVSVYDDAIGIAWGQIEVGLDFLGTGRQPSLALERRLASTLLSRARGATG
jgi:hypothetical protein